jgi:hypothetical protein
VRLAADTETDHGLKTSAYAALGIWGVDIYGRKHEIRESMLAFVLRFVTIVGVYCVLVIVILAVIKERVLVQLVLYIVLGSAFILLGVFRFKYPVYAVYFQPELLGVDNLFSGGSREYLMLVTLGSVVLLTAYAVGLYHYAQRCYKLYSFVARQQELQHQFED